MSSLQWLPLDRGVMAPLYIMLAAGYRRLDIAMGQRHGRTVLHHLLHLHLHHRVLRAAELVVSGRRQTNRKRQYPGVPYLEGFLSIPKTCIKRVHLFNIRAYIRSRCTGGAHHTLACTRERGQREWLWPDSVEQTESGTESVMGPSATRARKTRTREPYRGGEGRAHAGHRGGEGRAHAGLG